jgi:hypothetical protein
MTSLQELCYNNIADSINNAPPLLQEMIIGETKQRMRKKIKIEVENKLKLDVYEALPYLVPDILSDILRTITKNNVLRKDYHKIYNNFSKEIIDCAISIAEESINTIHNHGYVHNSRYSHNYYHDDDGDDDGDYNYRDSEESEY